MPSKKAVGREIVWSGTNAASLDYCCVKRDKGGWCFSGMIIAKFQTDSFGAQYEILVDKMFNTRHLTVEKIDTRKTTVLKIELRDGVWIVDGKSGSIYVNARMWISKRVPSPTQSRSDELH